MSFEGEKIKEYKRSEEEETQIGKEGAARFDTGKNRHDLIPPYPLDELAKVYTYGTQKYDEDNYLKGMKWRKVIGPLLRHLWKWIRGKKIDEESGCHHLAMVVWQCFSLMLYEKDSIGIDNRCPYLLDLMEHEERKRRILKWKQLAKEDKLSEYNGLLLDEEHSTETEECPICGYMAVVIKAPGRDDRIECGNMYCPTRNPLQHQKPN